MMIIGMFENIRMALTQLRGSKLRTALTMLGIIIGIAAVVVLMSLGQGVQDYVTSQFEGLGANLISRERTGCQRRHRVAHARIGGAIVRPRSRAGYCLRHAANAEQLRCHRWR